MVNILRKLFIKDYKNVKDENVRLRHAVMSSIVGIIVNLCLAIIKLIAGVLSLSISIIADAINNISDMASSIINLVGFKIASRPADDDHPYGHERIEYILGIIISVIILVVGVELSYNSILKIINPSSINISLIVIIILCISIVIKFLLALFYRNIGKLIDSVSIKAASIDSRNDCISTLAVLSASIIYYYIGFIYIDGIVGILLSIFIIISGISLVKESSSPLIGVSLNKEELDTILNDILKYDIVLGIHDVACHLYGPNKTFMTMHVEVPSGENILVVHEAIDLIEIEISKKYNIELVIHMDPIENNNPYVMGLKEIFENALKSISESLHLHDFRVVRKSNSDNIIFDVIKPRDLKISNDDITKMLYEYTKSRGNFLLVIKYEYSYIDLKEEELCKKN